MNKSAGGCKVAKTLGGPVRQSDLVFYTDCSQVGDYRYFPIPRKEIRLRNADLFQPSPGLSTTEELRS